MDDEAASPLAEGGFGALLRTSVLFSVGSIAGKVLGVVLLPLVTRRLSPAGYGRYDVLLTLATTVTSVLIAGLDVAATRRYAELDDDGRRAMLSTWLTLGGALAAITALALAVASRNVSDLLFGTDHEAVGVAMVGVYALGNVLQVVGLTALRNRGRAGLYAAVSTGAFVVNAVAVTALVLARPSPGAAMVGVAIGVGAGGLAALVAARRDFRHRPRRSEARALLLLGLPLVPAVLATWIGDFLNRAILLTARDAVQVGYLSVAVRFGTVAVVVLTGFQLAWLPRAFAIADRPEGPHRIAVEARRIVALVGLGLAPFAVLAPELVRLLAGQDYAPAVPAIGWALVTAMGLALFTVATVPSAIAATMADVGVAGTVGAAVGVLANVALAHRYGAVGTSAALAVGQAAGALVLGVRGASRTAIRLPWAHILGVAGAATALALGVTLVDLDLVVRLAAGAVFVAVALAADGRQVAGLVRGLVRR